ncbi:HTH domain-containing protein [Haloarchaeobius sp. TZWWS8]|uniref:HTH domain-containing protein n=1 Tax=Haloarchaeobius sp. TZWWS8 TaxID=3446121 RepID=UPI003EBE01E4
MSTQSSIELDVHLRAYAPVSRPQETVLSTARELNNAGLVDGLDVHDWPGTVRADRSTRVSRRYEEFRDWAAGEGVDIDQAFTRRTEHNQFTGETTEKIHTPIVCLAVYEDDVLSAVLPCSTEDDEHITATDYLRGLRQGMDLLGTLSWQDGDEDGESSENGDEEIPVLTA